MKVIGQPIDRVELRTVYSPAWTTEAGAAPAGGLRPAGAAGCYLEMAVPAAPAGA
jgi:hypothetical protein